ncbi:MULTISPECIES: pyruvate ferredoxin oxidoreductase subunit gamma [unclassified Halorhabdus]|uniref:pyruvate ferredoxin oxidoreductase subunit gamma n=1 Tax=unclassified Halorhabdus TaxID=2621901 RepID=UPI0023DC5C4B|nr:MULTISPECIES: pyruvate ferredoxin oxidoreductase subunit gamma [unclassified Halorhabdus]WEL16335.1 Pyruvate:ferredoxin oxidoreductase or related 2-oxoacid:ferredoxin oxidoreductase, gamma subunit [Halorhabdus sp. SVX81]WEL20222.1 Pyruvate:ferredoxin oxidoreductase or related 2-oxoacid:ferredoxin oxidoreductase, gamma subunit [Halorhabdus sp. BNX81]
MEEIRIHGRGGQGSVTLAQLLAQAAHEEGTWAQAFPAFGVERRGAPVEAFARFDEAKITDRSQVDEPDFVIVQDTSLLEYVDVTDGLNEDGLVLVNTDADPEDLDIETDAEVVTVDATEIALQHLGRPIMNTALLGAFAGATGLLDQESMEAVITRKFGGEVGEQNVAATNEAFSEVSA